MGAEARPCGYTGRTPESAMEGVMPDELDIEPFVYDPQLKDFPK